MGYLRYKMAVQCMAFVFVGLLALLGHSTEASPIELEFFNTVKQTFGLPGSLRTAPHDPGATTGLRKPLLVVKSDDSNEEVEEEGTAFGLTLVIIAIFGVIVVIVATYFCFSVISTCVQYITRRREKRQRLKIIRTSTVSSSETETSSLDSVSTE